MSTLANESSRIEALVRYFKDAFLLQQSLIFKKNDRDLEELTDGGKPEFVYFFDADIVHMFMHPRGSGRYVDAFGSEKTERGRPVDQSEMATRGILICGAALCAEYLFSGGLPCQTASSKPYLALDHAIEVQGFGLRLAEDDFDEYRQKLESFPQQFSQLAEKLDVQAKRYHAGEIDTSRFLLALKVELPQIAEHWPMSGGFGISQFDRLVSEDLVRPAAELREWTAEVMSPPEKAVAAWRDRIASAGTAHRREKPVNLLHDARVMAQLEMLNRDSEPDNKFYILVTGSQSLHDAYARWTSSPDSMKQHTLRHPRQFMALLNMRNMSNIDAQKGAPSEVTPLDYDESRRLAEKLEDSLTELLHGYFDEGLEPTRQYPERLPREEMIRKVVRELCGSNERKLKEIESRIDGVRHRWRALVEDTILYNAGLLQPICEDALLLIATESRRREVKDQILKKVKKHINNLASEHLKLAIDGALLRLISPKAARVQSRSPAWISYRFVEMPHEFSDTNAFLATFAASGGQEAMWDSVKKIIASADDRSYFFLGCTFLQSELWSYAVEFFDRARKIVGAKKTNVDDELANEIGYGWAVATRLHGVQTPGEFETALSLLKKDLSFHEKQHKESGSPTHPFQILRDHVEIGGLITSSLTQAAVGKPRTLKLNVAKIREWEREADFYLDAAERHLTSVSKDVLAHELKYKRLWRQLAINHSGFIMYYAIYKEAPLNKSQNDQIRSLIATLQSIVESEGGRPEAPSATVNPLIIENLWTLQWLAEPTQALRDLKATALIEYLDRAVRDESLKTDHDKAEALVLINFFSRKLSKLI